MREGLKDMVSGGWHPEKKNKSQGFSARGQFKGVNTVVCAKNGYWVLGLGPEAYNERI